MVQRILIPDSPTLWQLVLKQLNFNSDSTDVRFKIPWKDLLSPGMWDASKNNWISTLLLSF